MASEREQHVQVQGPDLPELEHVDLTPGATSHLVLDAALVAPPEPVRVQADGVQIGESELRGVTLEARRAPGLRLTDVLLRDCDLSNVDGREGSLTRVEIRSSRLVGFGLTGGTVRDLCISDSTLSLASFALAELHNVVFERVNLREATFMEAKLERVEFIECQLEGADFRDVTLRRCAMRGTALDGIVGVEALRGLTMPWSDVVSSAAALAAALGIKIES